MKFQTEFLGLVEAKDKKEVAQKIKSFCLSVSEMTLEQIESEQIIELIEEKIRR